MKLVPFVLVGVVAAGWLSHQALTGDPAFVSCERPVTAETAVLFAAETTGGALHSLTEGAPSSEVVAEQTLGTMDVVGTWVSGFTAALRGEERPASVSKYEARAVAFRQASTSACAPCPGVSGVQPASASSDGYSAEQLSNAAAIVNAGAAMGATPRDQTIGVMTALGESGLRVLDHGDQAGPDSRGLFQQRDNGAWGTYEERMDPAASAASFYRVLLTIPDRDGMTPTQVAHRVQRNADPNHYARYWEPAQQVMAALGGVTPVVQAAACAPGASTIQASTGPAPAGSRNVDDLVAFGQELRARGFKVSENAALGDPPSSGSHSATGWHYKHGGSGAIDVNSRPGTTRAEQRELAPIAREAMDRGFGVIFMSNGHFGHLHIDVGDYRRVGDLSGLLASGSV